MVIKDVLIRRTRLVGDVSKTNGKGKEDLPSTTPPPCVYVYPHNRDIDSHIRNQAIRYSSP